LNLLILGASARSAAFSALRIGLHPTCADLFADLDLASACPTTRVGPLDYPDGLLAFADGVAPSDWIYTGALENRPDLVAAISRRHRLLGVAAPALRKVRDPLFLAEVARLAGLAPPEVRLDPAGLPRDGSWLAKPMASAGGRGIRPWTGGTVPPRRPTYYQRRIDGLSLSALYIGGPAGARLLGATRQHLGRAGNRFAYRGSLGPWPLDDGPRRRLARLGEAIAPACGLVGLFGVDLVLRDGDPWPIEVNPRYTASVEVLEWALGRSLLSEHLAAFGRTGGGEGHPGPAAPFVAKAIVAAARPFAWPSPGLAEPGDPRRFPDVADLPAPGTSFGAGDPVVTVFARGDSPAECRRNLAGRVSAWRRRLRVKPGC